MKLTFSKFAGSARSGFLCLWAGVCLCPLAGMATDQIFINSGIISGTPPQVDAINFYNSGTWAIATGSPYETANTLTYTNTGGGSMSASPGWEFDLGPTTTGSRTAWSSVFFNDNGCTIQALDGVHHLHVRCYPPAAVLCWCRPPISSTRAGCWPPPWARSNWSAQP